MLQYFSTISSTNLPGLLKLKRPIRDTKDVSELVVLKELSAVLGRPYEVKQINHSHSHKGVIRGLHAERWEKVVTVIQGRAFSAIVDIRPDSPTFGKYEVFDLNDKSGLALYIPEGFANSICAISNTDYLYMVSKTYDGSDTTAVAWDDPDIAIPWPIVNPIISERDRNNPRLRDLYPEKFS
jgi:dTDP-4-dehydrorhamnose 3,5-epimerase